MKGDQFKFLQYYINKQTSIQGIRENKNLEKIMRKVLGKTKDIES